MTILCVHKNYSPWITILFLTFNERTQSMFPKIFRPDDDLMKMHFVQISHPFTGATPYVHCTGVIVSACRKLENVRVFGCWKSLR